MPILLDVPYQSQATDIMACWWYSTSMVMRYYGRSYDRPWDIDRRFDAATLPAEERERIASGRAPDHPARWFEHGLPPSGAGDYATLLHMEPVNHLWASWSPDYVEGLIRANGPLVLFGWFGAPGGPFGLGARYLHVIVAVGVDLFDQVMILDPAQPPTDAQTAQRPMTAQALRNMSIPSINPHRLVNATRRIRGTQYDQPRSPPSP
jgi:hypothetical protein